MLCFVAQLSVLFGTHLTGARHGRMGAYQLAAQPSGVGMTDFDHDGSTDQQDWSPSVSPSTCRHTTPAESIAQTQALSPYTACCRGTGEIRSTHFCISPVNSITCTRPKTALSFFALI